ncbi:MAG TPA: hypothetical protein PKM63_21215 [Panacibacter sp.]|nr:hypothetical protein [Panacibacter sp.]HNP46832.1 hypothetical protein [Panacibacter sp.]
MDYSFLILLASVFISRFILMAAFKQLPDEMKIKVLSGNVIRLSQITLVTTVIMVIVFYFMISSYPQSYKTISITFFVAIIFQRIFAYYLIHKNMTSNNVPQSYRRKYFLSWLVTTVGVIIFVFLLVKNYL